jgi:hypothetical protein
MTEKQQKQSKEAGKGLSFTDSMIGPHDVLSGRGGFTNNQNLHFRELVAEYQQEYLRARKMDKITIARRIVDAVRSKGGRFLKRVDGEWVQLSEKRAQEKTSQALREGLCVRNNTFRPNKMIKSVRMSLEENSPNGSKNFQSSRNDEVAGVVSPNSSVSHPTSTKRISMNHEEAHPSHLYMPELTQQPQQKHRGPVFLVYNAAYIPKTKKEQV